MGEGGDICVEMGVFIRFLATKLVIEGCRNRLDHNGFDDATQFSNTSAKAPFQLLYIRTSSTLDILGGLFQSHGPIEW